MTRHKSLYDQKQGSVVTMAKSVIWVRKLEDQRRLGPHLPLLGPFPPPSLGPSLPLLGPSLIPLWVLISPSLGPYLPLLGPLVRRFQEGFEVCPDGGAVLLSLKD